MHYVQFVYIVLSINEQLQCYMYMCDRRYYCLFFTEKQVFMVYNILCHLYLPCIFALTHPFGLPEEKLTYYQLYAARWRPYHAHVTASTSLQMSSIANIGNTIRLDTTPPPGFQPRLVLHQEAISGFVCGVSGNEGVTAGSSFTLL
jgi:hypothetical protein